MSIENMKDTTVIHGTLRPQDLLPEFVATAIEIDQDRALGFMADFFTETNTKYLVADEDHPWWGSEECHELIAEIVDLLCDLAPEGYYFGAHPGDGSDFGFWAEETSDE